jgi:hypothetical protein
MSTPTTYDVLKLAGSLGFRAEAEGPGRRPLATNCPLPVPEVRPVRCAQCGTVMAVRGARLGAYRRWGVAYCTPRCQYRAQAQRRLAARHVRR